MIPLLDLKVQTESIRAELDEAIASAIDSGVFVLGPWVETFEQELSGQHKVAHAVACSSGTAALQLALTAMGVGPGDEVITTSMTFGATVAAILYTGATPVLVDVLPDRWTIDPELVEKAISPRTKAIVPVHLHGRLAEIEPIVSIGEQFGIPILEDAAQAHLAARNGTSVGGFGLAGALSFYPGKNLGALGEGGAILTNDSELAERLRLLRNWGAEDKYNPSMLGFNFRMDAIQGAVLAVKMRYLRQWTSQRQQVASWYQASLAEAHALLLPAPARGAEHVYHVYSIRSEHRDALASRLLESGIQTGYHYPVPVHRQAAYAPLVSLASPMDNSEAFARTCLSLPIYPELSAAQVEEVSRAVTTASREIHQ